MTGTTTCNKADGIANQLEPCLAFYARKTKTDS